jgi:hypothetical protein
MNTIKDIVIDALGDLPAENLNEVLDFVLFLKQRRQAGLRPLRKLSVHSTPASHLDGLVGLVAWGGDALADTERLYD